MKVTWLGIAVMIMGGLQALPIAKRTNPVARPEVRFDRHLQVNAEMDQLLQRACMDCHSNETRWPWYSRVAPMSWAIVRDVDRGRRVMNLSEWSRQAGRRPEIGASFLAASCEAAKSGRMPRPPYGMIHREARLSQADVKAFCDWTNSEARRLIQLKRAQAKLVGQVTW